MSYRYADDIQIYLPIRSGASSCHSSLLLCLEEVKCFVIMSWGNEYSSTWHQICTISCCFFQISCQNICFLWFLIADDVTCFNSFSVIVVDYYCSFVVLLYVGLLCNGKGFINKVDMRLNILRTKLWPVLVCKEEFTYRNPISQIRLFWGSCQNYVVLYSPSSIFFFFFIIYIMHVKTFILDAINGLTALIEILRVKLISIHKTYFVWPSTNTYMHVKQKNSSHKRPPFASSAFRSRTDSAHSPERSERWKTQTRRGSQIFMKAHIPLTDKRECARCRQGVWSM